MTMFLLKFDDFFHVNYLLEPGITTKTVVCAQLRIAEVYRFTKADDSLICDLVLVLSFH